MYKFWQLHFKMVDEMSCLAFVFNSLDRPTGITDLFYKRDLVYTEAFTYQCARERDENEPAQGVGEAHIATQCQSYTGVA